MRQCPKFSGVLRLRIDDKTLVSVARCKSWRCPYCAPINARKLRRNITDSVRMLAPTMALFATLTASGNDRSAQVTYNALRLAWPKIRQWVLRHYGPFEYALIFERHKSGAYHAHLIMLWLYTPYYPRLARRIKRDLKDNGPKWGIGRQADAQMIDGDVDGAVKYISKAVINYMGKDVTNTKDGLSKGARLYYLSSRIKSVFSADDDDDSDGGWVLGGKVSISEALNTTVISVIDGRQLNSDDFVDSDYWPNEQIDNVDF